MAISESKREYLREYQRKNRERINAWTREYYARNLDKLREYYRLRRYKNPEKIYGYLLKTRERNPDYHKNRVKNDIQYHLAKTLRCRLYRAIKGNWKSGSAVRDLGCSIEEFKLYLESKFHDGMGWENYGQWHIDHIVPLSKFDLTNREELITACHYTNMQPLWASDNIRKGVK